MTARIFGKSAPLLYRSLGEYSARQRFVTEFRWPTTLQTLTIVNVSLAALVGLFGIAVAFMTVQRGVWLDEFITVTWTSPGTSLHDFLNLMITRDLHPILHYGLIYLLQTEDVTNIALLRSLNFLGVLLVLATLGYGIRQKSISWSQSLVVWIVFTSSSIFYAYFAELRAYFLIYSASIATSVLWYVLMGHIEADHKISRKMVLVWAVCLAIFVNLHYFATIFGGMLTATLLAQLVFRRLWLQALVIAGASLAAAAPALVLGALQVLSTPKDIMSWIKTSPIESIKMSLRMVEDAAARNLAVAASAVVSCMFILENRRKWTELRTALKLLGLVGIFLGVLTLANAVNPLMVERYLIAVAGAVTVSLALLAASSGAPVWMPAIASIIALLVQAQTLRSILNVDERGWLPSARAVAQLRLECPTTEIYAYPPDTKATSDQNEFLVKLKLNRFSYGYYATKFHFPYKDILPGATVVATGECPAIIWMEHVIRMEHKIAIEHKIQYMQADADDFLNEMQISKFGKAELKRYGSGALIIVRNRSASLGN